MRRRALFGFLAGAGAALRRLLGGTSPADEYVGSVINRIAHLRHLGPVDVSDARSGEGFVPGTRVYADGVDVSSDCWRAERYHDGSGRAYCYPAERARLRLSAHDIAGYEIEQWYRDVHNGYVPAQRSIPWSKLIKLKPAMFETTNSYRMQSATGPHWRTHTCSGWATLEFYDEQAQTVSGPLFELVAMMQSPE